MEQGYFESGARYLFWNVAKSETDVVKHICVSFHSAWHVGKKHHGENGSYSSTCLPPRCPPPGQFSRQDCEALQRIYNLCRPEK